MQLVHRIHRLLGSVLALLMAMWFVSGAVMTFAAFPRYTEDERLRQAPALPSGAEMELPPSVAQDIAQHSRLLMLEGRPTWVVSEGSDRRAYLTHAPWHIEPLDDARVIAQVEARLGKKVEHVERVDEPDQWTVGLARKGVLPLHRVFLAQGDEVYVAPTTGEIVQDSGRGERVLAWLGAIPHWIYPTVLRRQRELWKDTVLVLSALGLLASLSGTAAGLSVWSRRRRKAITRRIADVRLRWHQRLGLAFGVFVSTWLFSGALSLSPFEWKGDESPSAATLSILNAGSGSRWPVTAALVGCQRELEVRELELTRFAGRDYGVCYAADGQTRIVDMQTLQVRERVESNVVREAARALGGRAELRAQYDSYYFPRKRGVRTALPHWRVSLPDQREVVMYLDPARARLAQHTTRASRLERWLYHGLHSLDLPGLYEHRALWRTLVIAAMAAGAALSMLGFAMTFRKWLRRAVARPRR